ncbi:MAG: hypothetical protein FJ280_19325, partial [Planctomycetes bacterium]|nr:hypothetical protein [Planctomycetota bacterium]
MPTALRRHVLLIESSMSTRRRHGTQRWVIGDYRFCSSKPIRVAGSDPVSPRAIRPRQGKAVPGLPFFVPAPSERRTMGKLVWIICLIGTAGAPGQTVSPEQARHTADSWLQANPLALRGRQGQDLILEIGDVERLVLDASQPSFYLIHLKPRGYILMNSDRRLRPVVAFDLSGSPDLRTPEGNALHHLLLAQGRRNAEIVAGPVPALSGWDRPPALQILGGTGAEVIGPLLATAWDQGNHYNEFCPPAAQAAKNYDGRAPTGCVATAFAQIMRYHEWPYRGAGSFTYEDTAGSITGTHTAVFSDPYEWSRMQNEYYAFGQEPDGAVQAVAELMYELGVAARMDYEAHGSASAAAELARRIRPCFLYETPVFS